MVLPSNNINLNLYRVFYVVAMTKSFSESSKYLHISQPAISKHIQNLEYELDTILFYRTNRGIEPTPEAKILLSYVEKAYNILKLGEQQLQECKELSQTKISIGIPSILSKYYLNKYLLSFMTNYPKVAIKMQNSKNEELINALDQNALDLIITYGNNSNVSSNYKNELLLSDEYVFVYNENRLKIDNIESIKDLNNYNLILPSKETIERKKLDDKLNENNIILNPILELESNQMMINYIKEGLGIGYILKFVALQNEDLTIINIPEELPQEEIRLIYDEESIITSTKEFINLLKKNV